MYGMLCSVVTVIFLTVQKVCMKRDCQTSQVELFYCHYKNFKLILHKRIGKDTCIISSLASNSQEKNDLFFIHVVIVLQYNSYCAKLSTSNAYKDKVSADKIWLWKLSLKADLTITFMYHKMVHPDVIYSFSGDKCSHENPCLHKKMEELLPSTTVIKSRIHSIYSTIFYICFLPAP